MEKYFENLDHIIENYPKYFSQKEFMQWRSLFDNNANISKIEGNSLVYSMHIDDALPEQIEYGIKTDIFIEEWENIEKYEYGNIGVIKADYSLTTSEEKREGIDVLTLHKGKNGWSIVNLIYEQTNLIIF